MWSDRGDIEGTVHDGESLCLWLHQLIQSAMTRGLSAASVLKCESVLCTSIYFLKSTEYWLSL